MSFLLDVKAHSLIVVALFMIIARPARAADGPAPPVVVRGGLPNVASKLAANQPVTIVFLGGSVTRGGGDRGFVAIIPQWLQSHYPRCPIRAVNAGITDTDSAFGAARLERDALVHKPDLLFVEFSVVRGEEERAGDVERLIRKARTANPNLDIVFLYALSETQLDSFRAGKLSPAAAKHDAVAEHYGIPSIALALDPAARIERGQEWRELFRGEMLPTPQTYTIYNERITGALKDLLAAGKAGPHELPKPIKIDLVLGYEPAEAQPMPEPTPLVIRGGVKAKATYEMPVPGVHWIGEPEFKVDDRATWRLYWQSVTRNGKRLNAAFSLDRAQWGGPMRWFDEYRFFHGPAGVPLTRFRDNDGTQLSAREDDLPVVTFVAPRTGRYVFSAASSGLSFWGLHRAIAMNVVHFPKGKDKGTSIVVHRTEVNHNIDLRFEEAVQLNEGDELAFCVDANASAGGGGAMYRNFVLKVGYFGE